jgi:hypothetical protein
VTALEQQNLEVPRPPSSEGRNTRLLLLHDSTKRLRGEAILYRRELAIPLGPMTSVGAGEAAMKAAMIRILHDLLVFFCLAAFVTGIVLAAASLLI